MNADDYRELDDYRDERAREVRPIWIETDRHDDRLRTIVVESGTTRIASVQLNLRELGVIRRVIINELLGGSDRDALVEAVYEKMSQHFAASVRSGSAVAAVLHALDAVLSDAERRADR